jgi:hypothetical protein
MKVIQANRTSKPLLLGLVLFAALAAIWALWPNHTSTVEAAPPPPVCIPNTIAHPGPCRALINAATVAGNGTVASGLLSEESKIAADQGFEVTVVTDVTWGIMTATGGAPGTNFSDYELLIAGDPNCGDLPPYLIATAPIYGSVVLGLAGSGRTQAGNRIAVGTDVVFHGGTLTSLRGEIIRDGISYAGQQPNRTGMYFDTTCAADYSGQSAQTLAILTSLSAGVGPWTIHTGTSGPGSTVPCGGSVSLIASVLPAFATLTTASLAGWNCSVHEAFPTFPSDWSALAVATDAVSLTPTCGTDPNTLLDACGEPYILVAGSSIVVVSASISVTPPVATNPAGTNHTVTAHVTSGGSPLVGQVVTFTVTGQNAGAVGTCVPAGCVTNSNGDVSFTYFDANGVGDDTIKASFTDATGSLQSATAQKHWVVAVTQGCITIVKKTVPQDPSDPGFDFEWDFQGPLGFSGLPFAMTDTQTATFCPTETGIYNFSELPKPGWTLTNIVCSSSPLGSTFAFAQYGPGPVNVNLFLSWTSFLQGHTGVQINLANATNVTCTFTNSKDACITIFKQAIPDTSTPFNFHWNGPPPVPAIRDFALVDGLGGHTVCGPPGQYRFDELAPFPAGYGVANISCGSHALNHFGIYFTTVLAAGENVTCTFTNGTGALPIAPPVGGLVALSVSDSGSPFPSLPLAAIAAGVMAVMGAGLWYGRRRWLR